MDSAYEYHRDDFDDDSTDEVLPPVIGGGERRMHVRAYDYWLSLLEGRVCPSIQDLDPASVSDFSGNSVLLDFSRSIEDPTIAYLGRGLREECGMLQGIRTVSDVPRGSLLSRLTDHYLQILANKAPIGFEAEFTNAQGLPTLYRGILMPFTSDGQAIDYVYGVINWKHGAPDALSSALEQEFAGAMGNRIAPIEHSPLWPSKRTADGIKVSTTAPKGLWDWLAAARISAEEARCCDSRAHSALYAAIGRAYDFALTAEEQPDDYAALLEREGLTAQARAPMTPIVKLVFGLAYDKTRLTEYAAALSFARERGIARGELAAFLESFEGGLKGLVQAERARRAPGEKQDRSEQARASLRTATPQLVIELDAGDDEFIVLLARRVESGQLAILAPIADQALVDKAVRKAIA